jgi:hypothetical protein
MSITQQSGGFVDLKQRYVKDWEGMPSLAAKPRVIQRAFWFPLVLERKMELRQHLCFLA